MNVVVFGLQEVIDLSDVSLAARESELIQVDSWGFSLRCTYRIAPLRLAIARRDAQVFPLAARTLGSSEGSPWYELHVRQGREAGWSELSWASSFADPS